MDSVDESPAEPRPLSPAGNPRRRPHKRVSTACDECRKKRLRCTAGPRPCLNCQLYGALCTITPTYKKRGPVPSQSKSHRRTSADPLNTFNELGPPSPDNTRSDSTAEPAKRLPDNALLPQDGNISRLDSDAYMQDLTPSLQQEEEPHCMNLTFYVRSSDFVR
ncbi:hypothetical protein BDV95DRAFT_574876 [Massariosphaeria phaeospora]|uniref:Zn(2)-C6 fungal-type domain-containing protein n=1 Tax=Massariosphaeria phaeospora TaxID=100035 RepID=A0A7C8M7L1_9PLEO|nr:hypothetical protein BDV95DRAFT_574876 [Massariosphaeria phaeospora]